jgi:hypothetical protein
MDKFLPLLFKSFRDIYVYLFNGIFFLASITFLDIYYGDGVIYGLFRKIDSNIIFISVFAYVIGRIIISTYFILNLFCKNEDSETENIKNEISIFKSDPIVHDHFIERYNNNYLFFECLMYSLIYILIFGFFQILSTNKDLNIWKHCFIFVVIMLNCIYIVRKNFLNSYSEFKNRLKKI